jgi:hypothetical protein
MQRQVEAVQALPVVQLLSELHPAFAERISVAEKEWCSRTLLLSKAVLL